MSSVATEPAGFGAAGNPSTPGGPLGPGKRLLGDLGIMLVGDLLLWIATRKKSGTLHCQRRSTRKRLVFEDGALQACSSNDPREALGQLLLRERLIGEEQLFRALERQQQQGGMLLGMLLVSEGRLRPEQLEQVLRAKAEAIVHELFQWEDGAFCFEPDQPAKSAPPRLGLDVQALVQEGTRRRARWRRVKQGLAGPFVTFKALREIPPPSDPVERRILELALQGHTLAAISAGALLSELAVAEYLHALCELRALAVDGARADADVGDAVGAIESGLTRADQALAAGRFDAAFAAYQDVLALDALNRAARHGLLAVSDARKRARLAKQR